MTGADKQSWATRSGKEAPQRPRIVFEGHMAVFATNEVRDHIGHGHISKDGFDSLDQYIYVATPEEMRPENHEALKAKLSAKLKEAEKLPLSKGELEDMQQEFFDGVVNEAVFQHPLEVIKRYAPLSDGIAKQYNSKERRRQIASEVADNSFNPYDLIAKVKAQHKDIQETYQQLKKLYRKHGLQDEFAAIEESTARKHMQHMLSELEIDPQTKQDTIVQALQITRDENGRQRIRIRSAPIEKLYHELLQQTYADLNETINKAREDFVANAHYQDISEPFAYTEHEQAKIEHIHQIAHADTTAKPAVLAGYQNNDLTIIVEPQLNGTYYGRSYPGQDLILMVDNPKTAIPFESTMTEELLHQGIDKIYQNKSLPYRNDDDPRKQLLTNALAKDIAVSDGLMLLMITSTTGYNPENETMVHQEAPVKFLKYMDDGQGAILWNRGNPKRPDLFTHLEQFANEVIIKDAIAYNHGRPLQDIDMNYQRSSASHATQAEQRSQGSSHPPL